MRKFLTYPFSVCLVLLVIISSVFSATPNPHLSARWIILKNGKDSGAPKAKDIIRLRLQIKNTGTGVHKLNSADFYFDYDTMSMIFNRKAVAGVDYVWGPRFDPNTNPMYKGSQVIDFGTDPFLSNGLDRMDINIINLFGTSAGIKLDSGAWVTVVDVVWHIKKHGKETQVLWEMNRTGHLLTDAYDGFDAVPAHYAEGDGWDKPFTVKLE